MTLDEVLAAIQFWRPNSSWGTAPAAELPVSQLSTVDEARIIDAIRALYASTTARPVLIALATSGALKFGNRPQGEQYSAFANVLQDFVGINWHDVSLSKTINLNGVVVYLDPVLLIAHELYHLYSKSSNDPTAPVTSSEGGDAAENSLTDLFGPMETFANQVSSEIGRSGNSSAGYLGNYPLASG